MSEWQKVQIFDELAHYGVVFEVLNPASFESLEQCNDCLLEKLKNDHTIDVFLTCAPDKFFLPGVIQQIGKLHMPKVLIQFDNLHSPYCNKNTARYFDIVWLTSRETEYIFKGLGCKTIFQPYAASPFLYNDYYRKQIDRVCFVGTPYGSRIQYINEIISAGVKFDVFYGKDKKDAGEKLLLPYRIKENSKLRLIMEDLSFPVGRYVLAGKIKSILVRDKKLIDSSPFLSIKNNLSFEDMNSAYSNYALSLNVLALRNTYYLNKPVHKLHLRTFEIPMCAGLELVSYNEELAEYFTADEMVFFRDNDEMIDKVKFFLKPQNESLCRRMKIQARKKAVNEHSWHRRFEVILNEFNICL